MRHPTAALCTINAEPTSPGPTGDGLFARIAADVLERGYSIQPAALAGGLGRMLFDHVEGLGGREFDTAGTGRRDDYGHNRFVRNDEICWITGESEVGRQWLDWSDRLREFLNRRLFLGLFSFESHFAHYAPGAFYKRHLDAFKGEANRVLSLVLYLNPHWQPDEGGELLLYRTDDDTGGIRVTPLLGTLVVFLSEEFPHEVLPATRDRYSVAGWYRVNGSVTNRIDPPV